MQKVEQRDRFGAHGACSGSPATMAIPSLPGDLLHHPDEVEARVLEHPVPDVVARMKSSGVIDANLAELTAGGEDVECFL